MRKGQREIARTIKLDNLQKQNSVKKSKITRPSVAIWDFKSIHLISMAKISKQIGVMKKICDWFKCMNWRKVIHMVCHHFSYFTTREANDKLWIHICIVWVS
jgi:hypothetical protein